MTTIEITTLIEEIELWERVKERLQREEGVPFYEDLQTGEKHSPLCKTYLGENCDECPLSQAGKECHEDQGNPFSKWFKNEDIDSCQNMIDELRGILEKKEFIAKGE